MPTKALRPSRRKLQWLYHFFLGRSFLCRPNDVEETLRILVISALIYSLPMLFEIRMSLNFIIGCTVIIRPTSFRVYAGEDTATGGVSRTWACGCFLYSHGGIGECDFLANRRADMASSFRLDRRLSGLFAPPLQNCQRIHFRSVRMSNTPLGYSAHTIPDSSYTCRVGIVVPGITHRRFSADYALA